MIDGRVRRHRIAGLRNIALPARARRHPSQQLGDGECFELEPLVSVPVVERLLAIHVDIELPVVHAEVVLVVDAIPGGPCVWLVLSLREAGRPFHRGPASEVGRRLPLSHFATVPVEIGIAPAVSIGIRIEPLSMTDADGLTILAAAAHEHVLARLRLGKDEHDRATHVAIGHG